MKDLTNVEMWNRGYMSRDEFDELIFDWRDHTNRLIAVKDRRRDWLGWKERAGNRSGRFSVVNLLR